MLTGEDQSQANQPNSLAEGLPMRKQSELFQTLPGDFSLAQPFLWQQLRVQAVSDFLLQHNKKLFVFMSGIADQPNSLAEGLPV
eukprot:646171-Pelagomonas_calceolata.AAC.1